MSRTVRAVVSDCVRHVTQRGRNRQDAFCVDVAKLETFLGCRLRPLPRGRPPKPPDVSTAAQHAHDT
jgi:hypothetical protein